SSTASSSTSSPTGADVAHWEFEPGHSAAAFAVRHMMVTWVRGSFKDVHGTLEFDPQNPAASSVHAVIDTRKLWTGEPARDEHLKAADFLDVARYPEITFDGKDVEVAGPAEFIVSGDLTIRGVVRKACLRVFYLGQWETPY